MPPYGEADWATPGNTTSVIEQTTSVTAATAATPTNTPGGSTRSSEGGKANCFIVLLSILNIGLAAMMGALGAITLIELLTGKFDLTSIFLSIYMLIFATLLFLYEFIWWQPIAKINIVFRKNFGFLYGLRGKGFYMIFIAFLTLGLIDDNQTTVKGLDWATGIGWLFSGFFHIFVACSVPGSNDLYKPPTVGLSTIGENNV